MAKINVDKELTNLTDSAWSKIWEGLSSPFRSARALTNPLTENEYQFARRTQQSGSVYEPTPLLLTKSPLKRYQVYSGIALSTFVSLHIAHHLAAIVIDSPERHREWMSLFRNYYQNIGVEIGLSLAFLVHSYCNVRLALERPKLVPDDLPEARKWHRYCGYFLSAVIVGHVAATRLVPIKLFGRQGASQKIDMSLIKHSFTISKLFYPYYVMLFAAGLYHMVYGLNIANWELRKTRLGSLSSEQWKWLKYGSVCLGVLATLAYAGKFYDIPLRDEAALQKLFNVLLFKRVS